MKKRIPETLASKREKRIKKESFNEVIQEHENDVNTLVDVFNKPYPTGGIAILYFDLARWDDIEEKTGTLDAFLSPAYLKKNEKKN